GLACPVQGEMLLQAAEDGELVLPCIDDRAPFRVGHLPRRIPITRNTGEPSFELARRQIVRRFGRGSLSEITCDVARVGVRYGHTDCGGARAGVRGSAVDDRRV